MVLATLILKALLASPSLIVPICLWAGYQRQQSLRREHVAQPYPAGTSLIMSSRCIFHIWMASYGPRFLYAIQHRNMVLIDWRFSLAEQYLSRISICFSKKKKGRAAWFPNITLFRFFMLSTDMLLSPDQCVLDGCLWAVRQPSALPELSPAGAGGMTWEFFLLF